MIGQFKIKSMWFTIQQQNEKHSSHNHPKSILSGISYFKIDEKKGGELIIDKYVFCEALGFSISASNSPHELKAIMRVEVSRIWVVLRKYII